VLKRKRVKDYEIEVRKIKKGLETQVIHREYSREKNGFKKAKREQISRVNRERTKCKQRGNYPET